MNSLIDQLEKMLRLSKVNQQYINNQKCEEIARHAAEVAKYDAELLATGAYIDEIEAALVKLKA